MPLEQKIKDAEEYERVFHQYLEICNQAIEQNKSKFPYTEIWGARLKLLKEGMEIPATIYDDRPKAACTLRLTKEMKIEMVKKNPLPPGDGAWPFAYQFLKRVIDNPQHYIENPAKLEWGWLKAIS